MQYRQRGRRAPKCFHSVLLRCYCFVARRSRHVRHGTRVLASSARRCGVISTLTPAAANVVVVVVTPPWLDGSDPVVLVRKIQITDKKPFTPPPLTTISATRAPVENVSRFFDFCISSVSLRLRTAIKYVFVITIYVTPPLEQRPDEKNE